MMRGTWLVVMLVIVLMSVCESARISVEIAEKMVPTQEDEESNDWKDTACSWCSVAFSSPQGQRECDRTCRARLPGMMKGVNDWKDIPCSVCSYSPYPEYCERYCRGTLPGLALLKEEANECTIPLPFPPWCI